MINKLETMKNQLKQEENTKDKQYIKSFLMDSRPKFQSLGCGKHKGVFYFGTRLWKDDKGYDAVITDKPINNRQIFINKRIGKNNEDATNEIKQLFGLNYKDDFYDEAIDHIFSKDAIERFLYGKTDDITIKNVYDKLVKIFKEYLYFDNETVYKVQALYRIAGFFMHVWRIRARNFIFAEQGSAKSRLTSILHNTGFNSVNLGDWTLPFVQRMIESTRGETHIDDFETLEEEKQKSTIRLVKTGYMQGFKAGKTGDKTRRPEVYDLFNTTTLNNTEGIDGISAERCITTRIPKVSDAKYDKEPDFSQKKWSEIRDELYILGLKEAELVEEEYPKVQTDKISGRYLSIIKPELTIASIIDKELFEEVVDWWLQEISQRDNLDLSDDWIFNGYAQIFRLLNNGYDNKFFVLYDDVAKPVLLEMNGEYCLENKKLKFGFSNKFGKQLARNPIFKSRQVNGKTQYKVSKSSFVKLLSSKGWLKYICEYTGLKVEAVEVVEEVDLEMALPHWQTIIQEKGKKGYPIQDFIEKYGEKTMQDLKNQKVVMENPSGFLKSL